MVGNLKPPEPSPSLPWARCGLPQEPAARWLAGSVDIVVEVGRAAAAATAGPGALSQPGSGARGARPSPRPHPHPPLPSRLLSSPLPPPPARITMWRPSPANHSSSGRYLDKPRNLHRPLLCRGQRAQHRGPTLRPVTCQWLTPPQSAPGAQEGEGLGLHLLLSC